ncbi:MAG: hypothetical protein ACRDSP_17960 [Pseudonocardiaceae bacterium]
MNRDVDRLYHLLPSVYPRRDAERGEPLKALLAVITEQTDLIGADIDQLYEDWFVETCQDWVLPYLGELVGYRLLPGSDESLTTGTEQARRLLAAIAPRRDIAHTVGDRRRKGTLALLEQLAADVAGWPARAVEFRRLLGVTQAVRLHGRDHRADRRRLRRGRLADLHAGDVLDRVEGPFDTLAHTVDVRRINSARGQGRHNIPEVGLFVWRLRPYSITKGPAYCEDRTRTHFTFSILGNDTPLITTPIVEPSPTHIADETNVPGFIRRRAFADRLAHYYGPGKSLCIYREGDQPVPLSDIVAADLSGWRYLPRHGQVAVDPVLGRIAFATRSAPDTGVWVSYHYGFSDDLGGGEYPRPLDPDHPEQRYQVGPGRRFERIMQAVDQWRADKAADAKYREAVIELTDTGAYQEQIEIPLDRGDRLTVRAAQGARPVLRLLDWYSNRPDALRLVGTGNGAQALPLPRIVFDGLLVTGRSVRVQGPIGQFVLRHSTLVPGWSLDEHCHPQHEEEASIELFDTPACLQVERCILGTILVNVDETHQEPNRIWLSDTILDAAGQGLAAITAPDDRHAHAVIDARRTTVFGAVLAHAVGLVENCILDGEVRIARRQSGCLRFCWLPACSRTPPQFHCEPEHSGEPLRVVPRFTSTRYGTPGYAQLAPSCPEEIRRGAEDRSEMGVFHDLFQPQREDNLRLRLDEYTPAGCDAGIVIVT